MKAKTTVQEVTQLGRSDQQFDGSLQQLTATARSAVTSGSLELGDGGSPNVGGSTQKSVNALRESVGCDSDDDLAFGSRTFGVQIT